MPDALLDEHLEPPATSEVADCLLSGPPLSPECRSGRTPRNSEWILLSSCGKILEASWMQVTGALA